MTESLGSLRFSCLGALERKCTFISVAGVMAVVCDNDVTSSSIVLETEIYFCSVIIKKTQLALNPLVVNSFDFSA